MHGRQAGVRSGQKKIVKIILSPGQIGRPGADRGKGQLNQRTAYDYPYIHVYSPDKPGIIQLPYYQARGQHDVDIPEIIKNPGPGDVGDPVINKDVEVQQGGGWPEAVDVIDKVVAQNMKSGYPEHQ